MQWPREKMTYNTMAKTKKDRQYNGQEKKGQIIQWPREKRTDSIMGKRKKDR